MRGFVLVSPFLAANKQKLTRLMCNPCTGSRQLLIFYYLNFAHEWVIITVVPMPALASPQLHIAVCCLRGVTDGGSWSPEHLSVSECAAAAGWYLHQKLLSSRGLQVKLLLKCCSKSLTSSSSWGFTTKMPSSLATGEPRLEELYSPTPTCAPVTSQTGRPCCCPVMGRTAAMLGNKAA